MIGIEMCSMHMARVIGKNVFHSRCISWSYRNRGYDARSHRNPRVSRVAFVIRLVVNISGVCERFGLMKITHVKVFIIMMFAYSARKNNANGPPAYSTLNPETSSDSPSVRSKGARFVSATVEIYHIIVSGQDQVISQVGSCVVRRAFIANPPEVITVDRRIIPRVTSYEIVCATARSAPSRAYFEFEAHPDHKIEYTIRLDSDSTISSPRFVVDSSMGIGRGVQMVRARARDSIGIVINRVVEEVVGRRGSLVNSFTPSAMGCRSPKGPTIFGPLRSCM